MVYFQYSAICRRSFFDIFYIFSLLFGTRAHYSLALDIHCVYYLFKVEAGQGGKYSKCQQDVHSIVLVSQMITLTSQCYMIFFQIFCIYNLFLVW